MTKKLYQIEIEMKQYRVAKKVHEQEQILNYIEKSYVDFDECHEELSRERLQIVYESVYMDLYLLTLHQELMVLKKHEDRENELFKIVDEKQRIKFKIDQDVKMHTVFCGSQIQNFFKFLNQNYLFYLILQ